MSCLDTKNPSQTCLISPLCLLPLRPPYLFYWTVLVTASLRYWQPQPPCAALGQYCSVDNLFPPHHVCRLDCRQEYSTQGGVLQELEAEAKTARIVRAEVVRFYLYVQLSKASQYIQLWIGLRLKVHAFTTEHGFSQPVADLDPSVLQYLGLTSSQPDPSRAKSVMYMSIRIPPERYSQDNAHSTSRIIALLT